MFKLAITALIASASAGGAAADKAAMDKDAKNAEAGMAKYKVGPNQKIWVENKTKKENFMASTTATGNVLDFDKKTIDDYSGDKANVHGDCQMCVLSGNVYTAYKAEVAADKTAKPPTKEVAAVDASCASADKKNQGNHSCHRWFRFDLWRIHGWNGLMPNRLHCNFSLHGRTT